MNYMKLKAFTIFEALLALTIIGSIAMLMMPSFYLSTSNQSLYAALNKNYSDMRQTLQAVPMLQMKGQLAPGVITADMFMQALVLTHKCIDLKSDGTLIAANNKYAAYIYQNDSIPNNTNVVYGGSSYNINNRAGVNSTVILKNNVFVSIARDADTIVLDVNGRKGPNLTGRDIFFFRINNGVLQSARSSNICNVGTDVSSSGGCAEKYLRTGKMN